MADVAAHAIDPRTAEAWQPHVLGRRLPLGFQVAEYDAASHMVLRSAQGRVAFEATFTWEPKGTWTQVTLRQTGEAPGVGRAASILDKALARAMAKNLDRLVETLQKAPVLEPLVEPVVSAAEPELEPVLDSAEEPVGESPTEPDVG
jgi:hypothetical protein